MEGRGGKNTSAPNTYGVERDLYYRLSVGNLLVLRQNKTIATLKGECHLKGSRGGGGQDRIRGEKKKKNYAQEPPFQIPTLTSIPKSKEGKRTRWASPIRLGPRKGKG